jgi:pantoate--beta-alanine ligase
VFVNPTQFGPNEDFHAYPRTLEKDLALLQPLGVDAVFTPTPEAVYGPQFTTFIDPGPMANTLCGASRPGHFKGVCTVVYLLLTYSKCHVACFGEKDFQQLTLIKKMVADLKLDVNICGLPIVREPDGLAMSSRNTYLTPLERTHALLLNQTLCGLKKSFEQGEHTAETLLQEAHRVLKQNPEVVLDYISLVNPVTLHPVPQVQPGDVCALAAKVGRTRLIDNIRL